jgi:D-threo-aldose 1-dehydrogenase
MTRPVGVPWLAARPCGRTGFEVTPLCLGCAPLSSMPDNFYPVPEDRALELLRHIFSSPIRFLDTAAAYGDGESERRIGMVLAELGGLPAGYVLATKADQDVVSGDFGGEQTRRSVERSRRLLGLDHLHIVHLHDPEFASTSFEEMTAPGGAVDVLREYKESGVVAAVGVAGGDLELLSRFVSTGAFDVVLTHNRYTLVTRSANSLIQMAVDQGMAVLNAAVYGGGMLAKGPDSWSKFAYQEASPEIVDMVRRVEELCRRRDVPLAAAALQFSLRDPRITSTVVGLTRPERVAETIALASYPIADELWGEVDAVLDGEEVG